MKGTAVLLCLAAGSIAGCGSSSSSTAGLASSTVAETAPAAGSSTTVLSRSAKSYLHRLKHRPSSAQSGPNISGFGARSADWNAAHTAVRGLAPGAVYDADPSLPRVNGHEGARYYAVVHEGGRVLQYDMAFSNVPVPAVEAQILSGDFPPGVRKLWFVVKDSCAQMLVQSAILAKALGSKAVGDRAGTALIEFSSGASDTSYDAARVNDALFMLAGYTKESDAPAC